MATDAEVNAALDSAQTGRGANVTKSANSGDGLSVARYAEGNAVCPGRARWVNCTASDNAATQAAAILVALRAG
jgi:hypothetical protein